MASPSSSILRAIRPLRNDINSRLGENVQLQVQFTSLDEYNAYIGQLELYVSTLQARQKSFFALHQQLIGVQCANEAEQKVVDETTESDASKLLTLDSAIVKYKQHFEHLVAQRKKDSERNARQQEVQETRRQAREERDAERSLNQPPVKLPTIDLKKFAGNVTQWPEFWDAFESAIHKNATLSNVDKFNYLRGQLVGEAKVAISGISLTNENYTHALDLLKARFGNKRIIVNAHYTALANIHAANSNTASIRHVLNDVEKHLHSLEALGQDVAHTQFISLIFSKLPRDFILRLEETRGDTWTVPSLREKVQQLLSAREFADQVQKPATAGKHQQSSEPIHKNGTPHITTTGALFTGARGTARENGSKSANKRNIPQKHKPRTPCAFCNGPHWSNECSVYITLEERKERAKGKCFICLSDQHFSRNCHSDKVCYFCKKRKSHHPSLCPQKFPSRQQQSDNTCTVSEETHPTSDQLIGASESSLVNGDARGLLQTARAWIKATKPENKKESFLRLVFDSGSQRTYITQKMVDQLGAKPIGKEVLSVYTFSAKEPKQIETQIVELNLMLHEGGNLVLKAHTVTSIGEVHHPAVDIGKFGSLFKTLPLADPTPRESHPWSIDMLIGNNYYWDIITAERIELAKGLYLIGSKVGWVISGRIEDSTFWDKNSAVVLVTAVSDITSSQTHPFMDADQPLTKDIQIEDWWRLDTIGITDPSQDIADELAMTTFNDTIQYENQCYFVTWPWKANVDSLPTNYGLAMGRLKSLIRRFEKDPALMSTCNEIIQTQLEKGIIEKAPLHEDPTSKKHYIPFHPVITPDRSTTKVRLVYDGSAKSNRDNPSINECMHRGPVLLDDVSSLLIRFRFHKIALIADIEKAFLQVGLREEDRDVTRFLWLKDPTQATTEGNVQVYRFARVPFGIIASPFLLGATIQHHLNKEGTEVAQRILRDIYVDNLITGTSSSESAIAFYTQAKENFKSASMNLREWLSNDVDVMKAIPQLDQIARTQTKVLGLQWSTTDDSLQLLHDMKEINPQAITKRNILQAIAKVFDPLGIWAPVMVKAKVFLQTLWLENKAWDDPVPSSQIDIWQQIAKEMDSLSSISVPRYIGGQNPNDPDIVYELHCFTDASQTAYGACVYLRKISPEGTSVHLMFAKSRVAPTRPITLPRLELVAATVGGRLLEFVEKALPKPSSARHLWSDSQCTLHWIRSAKSPSVFVANRVKEIHRHENVQFHYVPTDENPADLTSRGTSVASLQENPLWWHGPKWLTEDETQWPSNDFCFDSTTLAKISSEEKKSVIFDASLLVDESNTHHQSPFGIDPTNYSDSVRLFRVTACCNRFIKKIKAKLKRNIVAFNETWLSALEIQEAKKMWIKSVQTEHFREAISSISSRKRVPIQSQLGLWLDKDGILRCTGRLVNARLSRDTTFPMLLPKNCWLTTLVIRQYHEALLHSGVAHTLAHIRSEFWIPSGRVQVAKVVKSCKLCLRSEGGPYLPPPMPALPASRVRASVPFTWTGLDYLGPLNVKHKEGAKKVWICIFTCMATRALHLELIEDMTAEQFLLCFRRFVSRRGTPCHVISDNAKTFKLAKATIDHLWGNTISHEKVASYVSRAGINWVFIPERAPWMGGFYERLVQSVKRALRKSIQMVCLTFVQLETVVIEIEAMLNSRPLVHVGSDIKDGLPLTPSHFLSLNPKIGLPSGQIDDKFDPDYVASLSSAESLLRAWKKGERHLQSFWQVWKSDYLLSLRERAQTHLKRPRGSMHQIPHVGDVVHVKQESPRGSWPLARVVELVQSSDGQIRTARVQLSSGIILMRAIMHLYPMEVMDDSASDENTESTPIRKHEECRDTSERMRPQSTRAAAVKAKEKFQTMSPDSQEEDQSDADDHEPARRVPTRPTRRVGAQLNGPSTSLLMTTILLTCMGFTKADGINMTFNLCGVSRSGYAIAVPKKVECVMPPTSNGTTTMVPVSLWVKRTTPVTTQAFKCTLRKRTICTSYSFFGALGARGIISDHTEHEAISPSDCKDAWQMNTFKGQHLTEIHQGVLATTNKLNVTYKWWGDHCSSVTNLFIEIGSMATIDGHTLATDLGDIGGCHAMAGICTLEDGVIVWNNTAMTTACPYEKASDYNATVWNNFLIIEDAQISLTVGGPTEICGGRVSSFWTSQGAAIQLVDRDRLPRVVLEHWMKIPQKRADEVERTWNQSDPVNPKLQYLYEKIAIMENNHFRTVWSELCRAANRDLHFTWQLLRLDPTLGARALTMQENIHASFAGDALMIWKCKEVHPTVIYWNQSVNGECFDYLPVEVEGSVWFVVPGSRDLVQGIPPVPCNHHIVGVYNQGGETGWQSRNGPVQVAEIPLAVQWKGDWEMFTFKAPSIFHDMFVDLTTHFGLLRSYVQKVTLIESQTERIMKYNSKKSLNPKAVYNTLKGMGAAISEVVQGGGKAIESLVVHTQGAMVDSLDKLLSGPLQVIINAAVIIVTIGITIVGAYYGLQCYCRFRRRYQSRHRDIENPSQPEEEAIPPPQAGSGPSSPVTLPRSLLEIVEIMKRESPSQ